MAFEKSLNDPLTAAEMKEIILARISQALDKNSLLHDDITYPAFGYSFQATITFPSGRNTLIWDIQGKPSDDSEKIVDEYQSPDSPNRTREDNDLPLPVMVQTPSGMEKRRVRYQKVTK